MPDKIVAQIQSVTHWGTVRSLGRAIKMFFQAFNVSYSRQAERGSGGGRRSGAGDAVRFAVGEGVPLACAARCLGSNPPLGRKTYKRMCRGSEVEKGFRPASFLRIHRARSAPAIRARPVKPNFLSFR